MMMRTTKSVYATHAAFIICHLQIAQDFFMCQMRMIAEKMEFE